MNEKIKKLQETADVLRGLVSYHKRLGFPLDCNGQNPYLIAMEECLTLVADELINCGGKESIEAQRRLSNLEDIRHTVKVLLEFHQNEMFWANSGIKGDSEKCIPNDEPYLRALQESLSLIEKRMLSGDSFL